ncbi:hypothetical protein [Burkholderia sp. TSV86]|uniref:hypothetical protein n=1 Tax=Burkholderia sp. TSV86 TaxID=1385594 RepID=UPI00075E0A07|nr:hypothetical protein [Burkholderia sp. TSV86]KVE33965.1 hypothetical protein WS68_01205 [Burkholderia sp. TSV86]
MGSGAVLWRTCAGMQPCAVPCWRGIDAMVRDVAFFDAAAFDAVVFDAVVFDASTFGATGRIDAGDCHCVDG